MFALGPGKWYTENIKELQKTTKIDKITGVKK